MPTAAPQDGHFNSLAIKRIAVLAALSALLSYGLGSAPPAGATTSKLILAESFTATW